MEITNWITKCYSTYANKKPLGFGFVKPTPIFTKPVYFKQIAPFKFTHNNEASKSSNNKTLIEMLEKEKLNTNKQLSQIKWEDIVSFGIVGLGLWAFYNYSGYKISFAHTPH